MVSSNAKEPDYGRQWVYIRGKMHIAMISRGSDSLLVAASEDSVDSTALYK